MGLLRDSSPLVRTAAAKAMVDLERTDFIKDLKVAANMEKDYEVKSIMLQQYKKLESMINQ